MAAFTSRTKNNNNSDNEKNILNGISSGASLHSAIAQLFKDGNPGIENKQPDGTLAVKSMHSFGKSGISPTHPSSSKQLNSSPSFPAIQRKTSNNNAQKTAIGNNKTGLPENLKTGVEQLSSVSLDDVKVHYNSSAPAQLHAHAYAQGTDIHVAPGQEKHLPHEAWHVVQQKQGRVQATTQLKGNVNINDNESLENEATQMGNKALNDNTQDSTKALNKTSIQTPTAQLWGLPKWLGGKDEEKEKPKNINDIVANHSKTGQKEKLGETSKEDLLKNRLAARRAALNGEEVEDQDTKTNSVESIPKAAGFNKDFQSKLGGMISTDKNEQFNKKRDAFEGHALKQSAYADRAKPGEENSWGSWFKSKANAVGRGMNNIKEAGKSKIGNTWLGKKMGISGLNKNERDAADAKSNEISRGNDVIKSYNKEGGELEGQASKIGIATTIGAFVAGKAPVGGKVAKNLVKAGGSAAQENRYNKASNAYKEDKHDALVNIGSEAKGKGVELKGKQAHLKTQEHLAGAAGAVVDELNPLGKLDHLVQEATMGYVQLPSAELAARNLVKAKNYKEQSKIDEESKGVDAGQALAFARQNTGGIDRKAFNEHKTKNKGLFDELGSKFNDGSTILSKAGISEKDDPKLKDGVLKHLDNSKKESDKKESIGVNEDMLARIRGMQPEDDTENDVDDDW